MKRVRKIPEPIRVGVLASLGDVTSDDIISVRKFDKGSDEQLMRFATGLDWDFQLSHHFRFPGVLTAGLKHLHVGLGRRLENFKASGGVAKGRLDWRKGVYTPTYDRGTGALLSLAPHWW